MFIKLHNIHIHRDKSCTSAACCRTKIAVCKIVRLMFSDQIVFEDLAKRSGLFFIANTRQTEFEGGYENFGSAKCLKYIFS